MNEKGIELAGQDGGDVAPIESLADIAHLIKQDNFELVNIADHLKLMNESLQLIMEQVTNMNTRFGNIAQEVKAIAEAEAYEAEPEPEAEKAEAVQAANEAVPVVDAPPVHGIRFSDDLAICGALGTAAQPFAARPGEKVSSDHKEITCPDCLRIIEETGVFEEKS